MCPFWKLYNFPYHQSGHDLPSPQIPALWWFFNGALWYYRVQFLSYRVRSISNILNESLGSCAFPATVWHLGIELAESHVSKAWQQQATCRTQQQCSTVAEDDDGVIVGKSEGSSGQVSVQRQVKEANLSKTPFPTGRRGLTIAALLTLRILIHSKVVVVSSHSVDQMLALHTVAVLLPPQRHSGSLLPSNAVRPSTLPEDCDRSQTMLKAHCCLWWHPVEYLPWPLSISKGVVGISRARSGQVSMSCLVIQPWIWDQHY